MKIFLRLLEKKEKILIAKKKKNKKRKKECENSCLYSKSRIVEEERCAASIRKREIIMRVSLSHLRFLIITLYKFCVCIMMKGKKSNCKVLFDDKLLGEEEVTNMMIILVKHFQ